MNKNSTKKFFDLLKEEIHRNEANSDILLDETFKEVVKKAYSFVKKGWEKLKNKIAQVASTGFRLGVAIGKLISGKFVLFNTKGEILTPPVEKIDYEPLEFNKNKKTLTVTVNSRQSGKMKIHFSDRLNFGFSTNFSKVPFMYVAQPKTSTINEAYINKLKYTSRLDELLTPEEEGEEIKKLQNDIDNLTFVGFDSDEAEKVLDGTAKFIPKTVEVDYQDFAEELFSLMDRVKSQNVLKNTTIKTIGIYAPTGWGKSQIIEQAAKQKGFFYWPIELAKVNITEVAGFPYLADYEGPDKEKKIKIVKKAVSQFLPPPNAKGNWLLFFDEFNRADMELMSAVMNLLLTGELGGAAEVTEKSGEKSISRYKLPKKIVVVLAMNTGTQKDIEDSINAVNNLDIATLERIPRILFGKYNATSWIKSFAGKPYKAELEKGENEYWLPTRVPVILLNYIIEMTKTEKEGINPEKPFLIPIKVASKEGQEGGGGERTTSPRSWTIIADHMIERAIYDWENKISDKEKEKMKEYLETPAKKIMASIRSKDPNAPDDWEKYLFAAWFNQANIQSKYLEDESRNLGEDGESIVRDIYKKYVDKGKTGVSIEKIIFDYKRIKDRVKKNFSKMGFGSHALFLNKIIGLLQTFKDEKAIEKYMNKKGFPILSSKGPIEQIYLTIKKIYEDLDIDPDDLVGFAVNLSQSKHPVLKALYRKFLKWGQFVEALGTKITLRSELEKEKKEKEKKEKEKKEKEKKNE